MTRSGTTYMAYLIPLYISGEVIFYARCYAVALHFDQAPKCCVKDISQAIVPDCLAHTNVSQRCNILNSNFMLWRYNFKTIAWSQQDIVNMTYIIHLSHDYRDWCNLQVDTWARACDINHVNNINCIHMY